MTSLPRPFDLQQRRAGVLLHVTSLPQSPFTGDLGAGARTFVDWLAGAGQGWWQMLPVNPIGDGHSPYSTTSSFAGEPLLIDPVGLVQAGWLKKAEAKAPSSPQAAGRLADFKKTRQWREPLLRLAYARAQAGLERDEGFAAFRAKEAYWLRDYALFLAFAGHYGTRDWSQWPVELRDRQGEALAAGARELADEIQFLEFVQYVFQTQWDGLRRHCLERGVGLIGDLPIFVSHRSADVWANPEFFRLDPARRPSVVAGCPPDAFNKDGQLWGNALYDWDRLAQDGFRWWIGRLRRILELFDTVRLDHFIGFHRYWEIDARAKTAREGRWQPVPGDAFFTAVRQELGPVPMIAEDLGAVVPEVRTLRDRFGFPGMKVVQFAFDGSEEARHHLPHLLPTNAVVYPGTHDNDTVRGWYQELARRAQRQKAARAELAAAETYLGATPRTVHEQMIRAAYASQAQLAVVAMQDVLGQGSTARMNTPGVAEGNWRYRMTSADLSAERKAWLGQLTRLFSRAPG